MPLTTNPPTNAPRASLLSVPERTPLRLSHVRLIVGDVPRGKGQGPLSIDEWGFRQLLRELGFAAGLDRRPVLSAAEVDAVNQRISTSRKALDVRLDGGSDPREDCVIHAFSHPESRSLLVGELVPCLAAVARYFRLRMTLLRCEVTPSSTHVAFIGRDGIDVGSSDRPDLLHPGVHLRSSGRAGEHLDMDDFWHRATCTNGLAFPWRRVVLRRSGHPDALSAQLVTGLGNWHERLDRQLAAIHAARHHSLSDPAGAVARVLGGSGLPVALHEEARTCALRQRPWTAFSTAQAITFAAHARNDDPERRLLMERRATRLIPLK